MFKVYVAGPMTGLPELNYPAFTAAANALGAVGYDVLNPADIDQIHKRSQEADGVMCGACSARKTHTWQWYMRQAIPMVCQADGLAVLPHWENSKGARFEVNLAETLEMPVASWVTYVRRHDAFQAGKIYG